jgi:hypothetical protein
MSRASTFQGARRRKDAGGRNKSGHGDGTAVIAGSVADEAIHLSVGPWRHGLLRGARHRARIRATRWLNDAAHPVMMRHRKRAPPKNFFIISVDRIFTTLFQRLFTNAFDVTAQTAAFACVYRACHAD